MALAGITSSKLSPREAEPGGVGYTPGTSWNVRLRGWHRYGKFRFMSIHRFFFSRRGRFGGTAKICRNQRVKMASVLGVACIVSSARKPDDALDGPVFLEEEWLQA
jgi:hypothetical protein